MLLYNVNHKTNTDERLTWNEMNYTLDRWKVSDMSKNHTGEKARKGIHPGFEN